VGRWRNGRRGGLKTARVILQGTIEAVEADARLFAEQVEQSVK